MDDLGTPEGEARALPLRMIVEWHYCARLFHYMHVEGLMVANEHVWRGRHAHQKADTRGSSSTRRKIDAPANDAPAEANESVSDAPGEWREARAVELGVTELGVVGKLDGVLLDEGAVAIPTELKSGSARRSRGPARHKRRPSGPRRWWTRPSVADVRWSRCVCRMNHGACARARRRWTRTTTHPRKTWCRCDAGGWWRRRWRHAR